METGYAPPTVRRNGKPFNGQAERARLAVVCKVSEGEVETPGQLWTSSQGRVHEQEPVPLASRIGDEILGAQFVVIDHDSESYRTASSTFTNMCCDQTRPPPRDAVAGTGVAELHFARWEICLGFAICRTKFGVADQQSYDR